MPIFDSIPDQIAEPKLSPINYEHRATISIQYYLQVGSCDTDAVFREFKRNIPVTHTKPPTAKTAIKAIFCFCGIWISHSIRIGKM